MEEGINRAKIGPEKHILALVGLFKRKVMKINICNSGYKAIRDYAYFRLTT